MTVRERLRDQWPFSTATLGCDLFDAYLHELTPLHPPPGNGNTAPIYAYFKNAMIHRSDIPGEWLLTRSTPKS